MEAPDEALLQLYLLDLFDVLFLMSLKLASVSAGKRTDAWAAAEAELEMANAAAVDAREVRRVGAFPAGPLSAVSRLTAATSLSKDGGDFDILPKVDDGTGVCTGRMLPMN